MHLKLKARQVFQCCWVNQIFAVCEEMLSRVTKAAGSDTIQMGSAYSNLVSENITHTDPWLWSAHIFMSSGEGFDSLCEPFAGQLTFGQNEHASRFAACFFKQTHQRGIVFGERRAVFLYAHAARHSLAFFPLRVYYRHMLCWGSLVLYICHLCTYNPDSHSYTSRTSLFCASEACIITTVFQETV